MAKISSPLQASMGGGKMPSPLQVGSGSDAIAGAVSSLGSTALKAYTQYEANEQRSQDQAATKNAAIELTDFRGETLRQSQEARTIQNEVAGFYEDDVLDETESERLSELNERLEQFDLLNPTQREIRRNAMLKQALNDPANERILGTIMNLYGGKALEPYQSPQEQALTQKMDSLYGTGNWNAADAGKVMGREKFVANAVEKAQKDIGSVQGDITGIYMALTDQTLANIQKDIDTLGAINDNTRSRAFGEMAQARSTIYEQINELRRNHPNGVTQADVDRLMSQVDDSRQGITKLLTGEGEVGATFNPAKRAKELESVRDSAIALGKPAMLNMVGSSGNAESLTGALDFFKLIQKPAYKELLTEQMGPLGSEWATQMETSILDYAFNADKRGDQAIQAFGYSKLAATLGANVVIPNADTPETAERGVTIINEYGNRGGEKAPEEAIEALVKSAASINKHGPQAKNAATLASINQVKNLLGREGIDSDIADNLELKDGKIVLMGPQGNVNPRVRAMSTGRNQKLEQAQNAINAYPDAAQEILDFVKSTYGSGATGEKIQEIGSELLQGAEAGQDPNAYTPVPNTDDIRQKAEELAPVNPRDLMGKPEQPPASLEASGFTGALSRLESGDMGYDSINAVPTGSYQGHTNARSYMTPLLEQKFGSSSLTERTVGELIEVGDEWAQAKGSGKRASGAMGFGQITPTTMKWLIQKGVVKPTDKYNKATQDKMVEYLLYNKQPAVRDYLNGTSNDLDEAVKALGQEWEAFSKAGNRDTARNILKSLRGN